MPAANVKRRVLLPESVDPLRRAWSVMPTAGVPHVSFGELRFAVPFGVDAHAVSTRAHELAHVHYTDVDLQDRCDKAAGEEVSHDLVNAVEDGRVNSRLRRIGIEPPYWPDWEKYTDGHARGLISDGPLKAACVRCCVEGTGFEEQIGAWVDELQPEFAAYIDAEARKLSRGAADQQVTVDVVAGLWRTLGPKDGPTAEGWETIRAAAGEPEPGEDEGEGAEIEAEFEDEPDEGADDDALLRALAGLGTATSEPEPEAETEPAPLTAEDLGVLAGLADLSIPGRRAPKRRPAPEPEPEPVTPEEKRLEEAPWRPRPAKLEPVKMEDLEPAIEDGPPAISIGGHSETELVRDGVKGVVEIMPRFDNRRGYHDVARWCPVRLEQPTRPWRMKKGRGSGRRAQYGGRTIGYPQRMLSDRRIFAGRRGARTYPGAVLVDCSSSMGLTSAQVEQIMDAYPAVEIRAYCSDATTGTLRVIAKDGRRVKHDMVNPSGGGNGIDGPALDWLARAPRPRFWISDGWVTGLHESFAVNLLEECAVTVARHRIIRVNTVHEFVRRFGVS
jgi:hypothetical protein